MLKRLFFRHLKSLQRHIFLDDLLHLGLDLFKILRRKRRLDIKIIIKPILNSRANSWPRPREQLKHSLSHDMACSMAKYLQSLRRLKRNYLHFSILLYFRAKITDRPINLACNRRLRKSRAYLLCNIKNRRTCIDLHLASVRKRNSNFIYILTHHNRLASFQNQT